MGVYLYSVRSKKLKVERMNGEIAEIRSLEFLSKESCAWGSSNRIDLLKDNAERYYNAAGIAEYVILGENVKMGDVVSVFPWGRESAIWVDSTPLGKVAFYAKRVRGGFMEVSREAAEKVLRESEREKFVSGGRVKRVSIADRKVEGIPAEYMELRDEFPAFLVVKDGFSFDIYMSLYESEFVFTAEPVAA